MAAPLSLEEAQRLLLSGLKPPGKVKIELKKAAGRVLAAPVVAPQPFPPFPRSLVDGYALGPLPINGGSDVVPGPGGPAAPNLDHPDSPRERDTREPWLAYRVAATIAAGSKMTVSLGPGTAATIFTGARPPEGTVAIIPREQVEVQGGLIRAPQPAVGKYLEPVGAEVRAGEEVLAAGTCLGPAEVGLLAALGLAQVTVYRRPVVAVAGSGSELLALNGAPAPEQGEAPRIYNSNFYALAAAVTAAGGEVLPVGPVADDLEEQVRLYQEALAEADLLLTTGGAGGSARDLTAAAFAAAGGEVMFTEVAIRPGRRVIAARQGAKLLLGLPGNPPAALVACYLLAVPVIKALGGREAAPAVFPAVLTSALDKIRTERSFIWARVRATAAGWEAAPLSRRPGGIRAAISANALIDVPPGCIPLPGEAVTVIFMG
ncbi:molybdopterin molybdotransferase MoeA [Moorella naiadis]|uniref:molybdopterin molybdotransferase MoeA n=1 Tax=Moorella naiadis (nom. illeg.) TaxID=3093670 RepID=UPI003D9CABC8